MRLLALEALGDWTNPPQLDRVMGTYLPLTKRPRKEVAQSLTPVMDKLLADRSERIQTAAMHLARQYDLPLEVKRIRDFVLNEQLTPETRIEAIRLLAERQGQNAAPLIESLVSADIPRVSDEALTLLAQLKPSRAVRHIEQRLRNDNIRSSQRALRLLRTLDHPAANRLLVEQLKKLIAGQLPAEIHLDLVEAAEQHRDDSTIAQILNKQETTLAERDPLGRYAMAERGGDPARGRTIFFEKLETQCVRCHRAESQGAGLIGPDLTGIGERHDQRYILESILDPNRAIAEGYEPLLLELNDGSTIAGTLKSETDDAIVVEVTPDGLDEYGDPGEQQAISSKLVTLAKTDIRSRHKGRSAMPEDVSKFLTITELRDLVAFVFSNGRTIHGGPSHGG